jgi:alpha-tubulin suppressor-like RCC1 family protein
VKVCAVGVSECPSGPYLQGVAQLVSGSAYNLALLDDGTVVGWGRNKMGQLGGAVPALVSKPIPVPVCTVVEEPCSPEHLLRGVTQIAAGRETSYALLGNGTVVAWGGNGREAALGDGKAEYGDYSRTPVQVTGLSGVHAIAADGAGGLALMEDGSVKAWGWNEYGTLGNGSTAESSTVPVAVCSGAGKHGCGGALGEVSAVYGSEATSYALLHDGSVMAWGSNSRQDLGDPAAGGPAKCKIGIEQIAEPCTRTPVKVDIGEVSRLATGQGVTDVLALLKDGRLMAWGAGPSGDLGAGREGPILGVATPEHVCAAYAAGPCPGGPYLGGEVRAMAVGGEHDLVYAPG